MLIHFPKCFYHMNHLNLNVISSLQSLGHALGEVDGAVLASRAAEGDLKMVAVLSDFTFHDC